MGAIIVTALTVGLIILSVLRFPRVKLGKITLDTYWVISLVGAAVLIVTEPGGAVRVGRELLADNAINPLKILVLFISMTVLSVFLDELGLFRYLASVSLGRAGKSQMKLFLILYLTVSVLTVFTSNDIIILSFTPFICYFAKAAGISPLPYLCAEFVAANTWSMALVIGNPTNIYLASAFGVDFLSYLRVMILPTVGAGAVAFFCLLGMFRRELRASLCAEPEKTDLPDKPQLLVGILHLALCTVALAVSSYVGFEMWIIAACAAVSLFVWSILFSVFRRNPPATIAACARRAPWQLIPFVLSMFSLIILLDGHGVTSFGADLFGERAVAFVWGGASFLGANLLNNIPMSVFFCSMLSHVGEGVRNAAVFATVIGSNLGALLTPVGALAGIMWNGILSRDGHTFGIRSFLRMGLFVGVPALAAALGILALVAGF